LRAAARPAEMPVSGALKFPPGFSTLPDSKSVWVPVAHQGVNVYAIIEDGGKQYKVSEGDVLLIERRDLEEGQDEIVFDRVLMMGEGADARIGTPWVNGATVTAKVSRELKMPKVNIVKFKRRKGYLLRKGHRQKMLRVEISAISG
jgi:large subunit ribosomal protein L21